MNTSDVAIRVDDLRKRYRGGVFGRSVDALLGVSFEIPKGQIFGLLGPNGAGKTTVIKILLGIVRATGGKATLLGHPAGKRQGRTRVGYLPENLQVPRHQTARTALEYYGRLSGMDYTEIKKKSSNLLDQMGLGGRQKESVKQFSKGMRQRLGLAQALLHDPELLILDEPTDGLDPVGRSQVRDIMRQLKDEGRTVFVNSHLLQEVELVCDNVAILNHGELKHIGDVEELTSVASDAELEMQLVSDESTVKDCLVAHKLSSISNRIDGLLDVSVTVREQDEINAIIDTLRSRQISIIALSRRKKTLEDFFLDVVNKKAASA